MPETGTSGLMSGERKRNVAAWPKSPRLSSTLLAHPGYEAASATAAWKQFTVALDVISAILVASDQG